MSRFHRHLDGCARCAERPFDLCPVGAALLRVAALGDRDDSSRDDAWQRGVDDWLERVRREARR